MGLKNYRKITEMRRVVWGRSCNFSVISRAQNVATRGSYVLPPWAWAHPKAHRDMRSTASGFFIFSYITIGLLIAMASGVFLKDMLIFSQAGYVELL